MSLGRKTVGRSAAKADSAQKAGKAAITQKALRADVTQLIDYLSFSPAPVVGVDEVGRGCLAGPVYAAAVCFKLNPDPEFLNELTDSKLLSESRRESIAKVLLENHFVGIGSASVEEIDAINILQASLLAMARAVAEIEKQMGRTAGYLLVDGNQRIPRLKHQQLPIVKGDLRCKPISAASIVAKVTRDQLMKQVADVYPQYGFEKHKGYASEFHRTAIAQHGPTLIHRRSFGGVKEHLAKLRT